MKRFLVGSLAIAVLLWSSFVNAAFTEFCARSGGSNLAAGTRTGNSTVPAAGSELSWAAGNSDGTSIFTIPGGGTSPVTAGVAVDDFGSVYVTAGATVATFIGRITARDATTITFSTTAKSGTFPAASAGANTISCKVGGAWSGPAAGVAFPFNFAAATMRNAADDPVRINLMNDAQYNITTGITQAVAGPLVFQGFKTAYGDGKDSPDATYKATIDGGTSDIDILTTTGAFCTYADLIVANNGSTTTIKSGFVSTTGAGQVFIRCVAHDTQLHGFSSTVAGVRYVACEAYRWGKTTTAGAAAGFKSTASDTWIRCIAHDPVSTAGATEWDGFWITGTSCQFFNCIADTVPAGSDGWLFENAGAGSHTLVNCDVYSSGEDGISFSVGGTGTVAVIINCNFVNCTNWGITGGATLVHGQIINCGFAGNTDGNVDSATFVTSGIQDEATFTYPPGTTPWANPAGGDFRIVSALARGTGSGLFTQTQSGHSGTVSYPDVGAGQTRDRHIRRLSRGLIGRP
jgi:hypothetical protein